MSSKDLLMLPCKKLRLQIIANISVDITDLVDLEIQRVRVKSIEYFKQYGLNICDINNNGTSYNHELISNHLYFYIMSID